MSGKTDDNLVFIILIWIYAQSISGLVGFWRWIVHWDWGEWPWKLLGSLQSHTAHMAEEKLLAFFIFSFSGGIPFSHLWGQAWKCFPVLNGLMLEHVALMCTKTSLILSDWNGTRRSRSEIQQSLSLPFGMTPMFIFMTIYSYYVNDKFIYIINIHIYDPGGITESRIVSSQCLKLAFEIICCAWRSPELKAELSLVCQAVAWALSCSQGQLQGSLWQELFGLRTFFSWCRSDLSSDLAAASAAEIPSTQQSSVLSLPSCISQFLWDLLKNTEKKPSFSPPGFYLVVCSFSPNTFSISFSLFLPDFI